VQNVVPVEAAIAERSLAERRNAYAAEARRFIDAALAIMRDHGTIDPPVRDVVREAGLSNQAFYRHFDSKDALLVAVLADGQRQLVSYVEHRIARVDDPRQQVRRWIEAVMEQARNTDAAAATRPFAVHRSRLAAAFPDAIAASHNELVQTLLPAVRELGGDDTDAALVHDLTMTRMIDALAVGRVPDRKEVAHLARFCLAGIGTKD